MSEDSLADGSFARPPRPRSLSAGDCAADSTGLADRGPATAPFRRVYSADTDALRSARIRSGHLPLRTPLTRSAAEHTLVEECDGGPIAGSADVQPPTTVDTTQTDTTVARTADACNRSSPTALIAAQPPVLHDEQCIIQIDALSSSARPALFAAPDDCAMSASDSTSACQTSLFNTSPHSSGDAFAYSVASTQSSTDAASVLAPSDAVSRRRPRSVLSHGPRRAGLSVTFSSHQHVFSTDLCPALPDDVGLDPEPRSPTVPESPLEKNSIESYV